MRSVAGHGTLRRLSTARHEEETIFARDVVGDVTVGALSPYSRTAGPAAALPAAWSAALDAALGPAACAGEPVRWSSGHPWAERTRPAALTAALPWAGRTATDPAVTEWFDGVVSGPAAAPVPGAAQSRAATRESLPAAERPCLDALHHAAESWSGARERAADTVAVLAHDLRLVAREQADQAAAAGLVETAEDYFQLERDELPGLAAGGPELAHRLRLRGYDHRAMATFRPPLRVTGPPPPAVRWPRTGGIERLGQGGGLSGVAAAPGTATGPVAVLRTPADAPATRAGDVLVVPTGCASWRPLLVAAAAVVVDAGWAMSPVAVTCRELGVPCVVGVEHAGGALASGTPVEVDGGRGTVTVTDGPPRRRHPAGRVARR